MRERQNLKKSRLLRGIIFPASIVVVLALGTAGCGGEKVAADEVPGEAPELSVPKESSVEGSKKKSNAEVTSPGSPADSTTQTQSQPGQTDGSSSTGGASSSSSSSSLSSTGGASPSAAASSSPSKAAETSTGQSGPRTSTPSTRTPPTSTGGATAPPPIRQSSLSSPTTTNRTGSSTNSSAYEKSYAKWCRENPGPCGGGGAGGTGSR